MIERCAGGDEHADDFVVAEVRRCDERLVTFLTLAPSASAVASVETSLATAAIVTMS